MSTEIYGEFTEKIEKEGKDKVYKVQQSSYNLAGQSLIFHIALQNPSQTFIDLYIYSPTGLAIHDLGMKKYLQDITKNNCPKFDTFWPVSQDLLHIF